VLSKMVLVDSMQSLAHWVGRVAWMTLGEGRWLRLCERCKGAHGGADAAPDTRQAAHPALPFSNKRRWRYLMLQGDGRSRRQRRGGRCKVCLIAD